MLNGVQTGGSTILSLQLQWDEGTSGATWSTVLGYSPYTTTSTYTITGDRVISGRMYKFRYRAANIHGWGPYSDTLNLLAASIPTRLNQVVVNLVGTQVQISWIPLNSNGAQITQYKIELKAVDNSYQELTSYCDGTDPNVQANNYCLFPMSIFMDAPLSLQQGALIIARVAVKNDIGWTLPSIDNTVGTLVQTKPQKPLAMTYDPALTDTSKTTLSMTAFTDSTMTGGSPIVSYSLEWDNGQNGASWIVLNGDPDNNIQLLYTMNDLTPGSTYNFRYRVRNIFGWSPLYSDLLTILAATKPDRPTMLTTTNVGTSVQLTWIPPYNGDSPILYYVLVIKSKAGTYHEQTTYCNARSDATVISNSFCVVPMDVLTAAPYNLV